MTIGYRTEDGPTSAIIVTMGPSCLVFQIRRWDGQPDDGPKTENIALSAITATNVCRFDDKLLSRLMSTLRSIRRTDVKPRRTVVGY